MALPATARGDGDWLPQPTRTLSPVAARTTRTLVVVAGRRSMRSSLGSRI